jgi:hypothetical protein
MARFVYLNELQRQCQFALIALSQLSHALNSLDGMDAPPGKVPNPEYWMLRIWSAAQSFLGSVANASKLLFPPDKKPLAKTRGEELRALLGINNDSLLADRTLRNDFEHFDERLDTWGKTNGFHEVIDGNIGMESPGAIGGANLNAFVLRDLDSSASTIRFQNHRLAIQDYEKYLHNLIANVRVHLGMDRCTGLPEYVTSLAAQVPGLAADAWLFHAWR